jgi:hypothetical protein
MNMAYYYDHTHTREDHPASHVDKPGTVVLIYLILAIGAVATISVSFAGLGDKAIWIHMLI